MQHNTAITNALPGRLTDKDVEYEVYSQAAAAGLLGITRSKLLRLVRDREIRTVETGMYHEGAMGAAIIGARRYILADSLEAHMERLGITHPRPPRPYSIIVNDAANPRGVFNEVLVTARYAMEAVDLYQEGGGSQYDVVGVVPLENLRTPTGRIWLPRAPGRWVYVTTEPTTRQVQPDSLAWPASTAR